MNVAVAPQRVDPTLRRPIASEPVAEHATPRGCPFLLADAGGWRLGLPSRDHRCAAFVPSAPLSPEKQTRLCLRTQHTKCATYLASRAARTARLGSTPGDRTTRWGLARTTTVIEDPGGVRAWILGAALDRRRWPAIPALLLIATLFTLALSGFRADLPAAAIATATPGAPTTPAPTRSAATAAPVTAAPPTTRTAAETAAPSEEPNPTSAPTVAPTPGATGVTPSAAPSFRTYEVERGDTLSALAARFDTSVAALVNLNDLTNAHRLHIGQVLLIPE